MKDDQRWSIEHVRSKSTAAADSELTAHASLDHRDSGTDRTLTAATPARSISRATVKTRRKGYKVMSRRCQMGTEVIVGNWYRVRVRVDLPGKGRVQKSFPICPVSGPGTLDKAERMRKRLELVAQYNSEDYLQKVVAEESGMTFRTQSIVWMQRCRNRRRKPPKPSTLVNWRSHLDNHILPVLGDRPLANIKNGAMKELVETLAQKKLSPQTVKNITATVKLVVSSAVSDDGDQLYPVKWNHDFIDMPPIEGHNGPSFTADEVRKIVSSIAGTFQMLVVLSAASGLRAGELLGLEPRHFDGTSLHVEQEAWNGKIQQPKTANAIRTVDLHRDVGHLLQQFIGGRTQGFIFQTKHQKPLSPSNLLKRQLHPLLEDLGITKRGFHAFRRFRNTYLRLKKCPEGLLKFWMGHARKDMTDVYDHIRDEVKFRQEIANEIGVGFDVPKNLQNPIPVHHRQEKPSTVPNVPSVHAELTCASN